jgi:hypothetical protein
VGYVKDWREKESIRKETGVKEKEKSEREKGKDGAALSIGDPPTFFFLAECECINATMSALPKIVPVMRLTDHNVILKDVRTLSSTRAGRNFYFDLFYASSLLRSSHFNTSYIKSFAVVCYASLLLSTQSFGPIWEFRA